jgi:hypothetical protein
MRYLFEIEAFQTQRRPSAALPSPGTSGGWLQKQNNATRRKGGADRSYLNERQQQELLCAHHFLEILQGEPVRPAV